jgi:argininosuccinate lyase
MTTGSSIMPQKRNPDLYELARGRAATALAALVEALAIPSRLPSGYHRDLQLLKAPLFRSADLARATSRLFAETLPRVRFRRDRIRMDGDLDAAERAHRLVLAEGIPFREAYRRIAARIAAERGSARD